jgi:hypothetical protein
MSDKTKPSTEASNKSYQLFLGVLVGVSVFSFYHQVHIAHWNDTITLELPWQFEFQIRHKGNFLRTRAATEEPFSKDDILKPVFALSNPYSDKTQAKTELTKTIATRDRKEEKEKKEKLEERHDGTAKPKYAGAKGKSSPVKADVTSKTRLEKADADYMERLKRKAQHVAPTQGGLATNKDHLKSLATATKNKLVAHIGDKPIFFQTKAGAGKLAADKTPGTPKIILEDERQAKKRRKMEQRSNHTIAGVPKLTGADLDKAIKETIKPRRLTMPPAMLQMCEACEESFIEKKFACKRRIFKWIEEYPAQHLLEQGQAFVANENEKCKACHPDICKGSIHFPYRFDEGQPLVLKAKTHDLTSIPQNHRIPKEFLFKTGTYFKFWTQDRPPVFFTYNPSIIPLPSTANVDVPGATYLATYRVSPWHNCGFQTYNFHTKLWNLMGLAVLDRNLDIIPGYDVIVNINEQTQMRDEAQKFEDFRLFYFNDKIWLLDGSLIVPIQVASNHKGELNQMKDRLPVLFGTGLTVGFLEPVQHLLEVPPGKNYNIFTTDSGVYMENKPRNPRTVTELEFDGMYGSAEHGVARSFKRPADSYVTDEVFLKRPYLLGKEKGGACCVKLERQYYEHLTDDAGILKHNHLLLGIGHRRTFRKARNEDQNEGEEKFDYLNRLYAFTPESPFDIVANSGMFCFGFPEEDEAKHLPYANATKHLNQMEIANRFYPCPTVQYASGMTQKVDDLDRIIVSYGVNDCVPRMVELHKQDLAHRLFLPLSRQDYAPKPRSV